MNKGLGKTCLFKSVNKGLEKYQSLFKSVNKGLGSILYLKCEMKITFRKYFLFKSVIRRFGISSIYVNKLLKNI